MIPVSSDRRFWLTRGLALAALAFVLVAAQCQAPGVRIVAPAGQHALTHMPLTIDVEYQAAATPGSLLVTLNGVDVTGLLVEEPPAAGWIRAGADFVWGAAFVLAGTNTLVASVEIDGGLRSVTRQFETIGDPYADAVTSYAIGTNGGFNQSFLPDVVLGAPAGGGLFGGTLDVFSLGLLGEIVLEFSDNVIVDGPGVDFTVFENPFLTENQAFQLIESVFSEAGRVGVSQDGVVFVDFACAQTAGDHPFYVGCAGVYPALADGESDARHPSVPTFAPPIASFIGMLKPNVVVPDGSGGDSFDLADVGLAWARYVRVRAADHVVGPGDPPVGGFDLDAVAAVNSAPATDADGNGIPDAVQ